MEPARIIPSRAFQISGDDDQSKQLGSVRQQQGTGHGTVRQLSGVIIKLSACISFGSVRIDVSCHREFHTSNSASHPEPESTDIAHILLMPPSVDLMDTSNSALIPLDQPSANAFIPQWALSPPNMTQASHSIPHNALCGIQGPAHTLLYPVAARIHRTASELSQETRASALGVAKVGDDRPAFHLVSPYQDRRRERT